MIGIKFAHHIGSQVCIDKRFVLFKPSNFDALNGNIRVLLQYFPSGRRMHIIKQHDF